MRSWCFSWPCSKCFLRLHCFAWGSIALDAYSKWTKYMQPLRKRQNDRMISFFPNCKCMYITDILNIPLKNNRYSTYLSAALVLCLQQYLLYYWPRMCNFQNPDHCSSAHLLWFSIPSLALLFAHSGLSKTRLASGHHLQHTLMSHFVQSKIGMLQEWPSLL